MLGSCFADSPGLTNAFQIRLLTQEQAAQHFPVRLRGLCISEAEPLGMAFVLMDATDCIYLHGPFSLVSQLERGDFIEVTGKTDPGAFAPMVVMNAMRKLRREPIPSPRRVTFEQLHAGGLDAQWVEVSGVVRSCEPLPWGESPQPPPGLQGDAAGSDDALATIKCTKIKLVSGTEQLVVQVNAALAPEDFVDAEMQLRGTCFNQHNANRQFLTPVAGVSRVRCGG